MDTILRKETNNKLQYKAVYQDTVYFASGLKTVTLEEIFDKIQTSDFLKTRIDNLRVLQTEEEQKDYKANNLPYFNLGTFKNNHRKNINLLSTSFFLYDYDHLDNRLESIKSNLRSDPKVFAYFVSPRGNGLKVIYRLDKEITDYVFFSQLYKYYAEDFQIELGADPDKTSDTSRPCYFSYDPELYCNPEADTLQTDIIIPTVIKNYPSKKTENTEIFDTDIDPLLLSKSVKYLQNLVIEYNDWIACGFALAPLGEYGRQFFRILSDNPNYKDRPAEIDSKFNDFVNSRDKYNELDTLYLIAAKYGFEPITIREADPPAEPMSFDRELEEQFLLDDSRDPNKLLGFPLTKFKELAGYVDGIQAGFYLLGAESNVGKTAVLTNMCLDVLETNPDVTVMYFSLDDSRKYTAYRYLSIMTQLSINETRKQQAAPDMVDLLNYGRKKLVDLVRSKRLIVKDTSEVYNIEQLKSEIENIPDKSKLVVFIDGLYNLEVSDKFRGGIREENIERARQVKLLVDKYRLPILTTGELRKKTKEESKDKAPTMHDLMETGKFAYNANVVWMLYGKTEDLRSDNPILTLEYVKNKLSDYKGIQNLTFKRATGTMNEVLDPFAKSQRKQMINAGGGLE